MAKARAICTCKRCGQTFTREAYKRNTREAAAWEAWAVDHFDTCPDCYRAEAREAEKEKGLEVELRLDGGQALFGRGPSLVMVAIICGYDYRDQLKAAGYRLTEYYPSGSRAGNALADALRVTAPPKMWCKTIAIDDIQAETAAVEAMGGHCILPSREALSDFAAMLAAGKAERDRTAVAKKAAEEEAAAKKAAAMEAAGPIPEYPADLARILAGGRWNGKIYGKPGAWRIYISGTETPLTDAQKKALEETSAARRTWKQKVNQA